MSVSNNYCLNGISIDLSKPCGECNVFDQISVVDEIIKQTKVLFEQVQKLLDGLDAKEFPYNTKGDSDSENALLTVMQSISDYSDTISEEKTNNSND